MGDSAVTRPEAKIGRCWNCGGADRELTRSGACRWCAWPDGLPYAWNPAAAESEPSLTARRCVDCGGALPRGKGRAKRCQPCRRERERVVAAARKRRARAAKRAAAA
ncbi:MAG: hypothetical protein F4Y03_08110 [Alphaproteobacteria bacterium]|nr:hypothetical protein [Alphaproteobacteria bacterium]